MNHDCNVDTKEKINDDTYLDNDVDMGINNKTKPKRKLKKVKSHLRWKRN